MSTSVWAEGLWRDIRHGTRGLLRSPGLVAVSALSLGLGIGVNTILYMAVSTIYFHEPTMRDAERLVGVEPGNANQFSYPDYRDLQDVGSFDGVAGFRMSGMNLGPRERAVPVSIVHVSANFFEVLGVVPARGRLFLPVDDAPEREPRVVVVTDDFWRSRLDADPDAIGQSVTLNGQPFSVIGVLPPDYAAVSGWIAPDLYAPVSRLTLPTLDERGTPSLTVFARLRSGVTPAHALQTVTALGAALERQYPEQNKGMSKPARVFPANDIQFQGSTRGFRAGVGMLTILAGLVLTIACINVMGLLMARAARQRREIAIRVAVGGGRWRVAQTILVEAALLVFAGAAVGLPLAFLLNEIPFIGSMTQMRNAMTFDGRLLPFSIALVAGATLVCGLVPALRSTRSGAIAEVRRGGETTTPPLRVLNTLVGAQVAMSLVMVLAAALCVRSQWHISRVDVGFDLNRGVVARFGLDDSQHPLTGRPLLAERLVERITRIPGVTSAAAANLVPLGGDSLVRSFHPAGRTDIPGTRPSTFSVGPSYFRTMGIPFVRGQDFDVSHAAGARVVAIVNETYAMTYFPDRDPIGQAVQTEDEPEAVVIGIVRDHRIDTIGEAPKSVVYYPYAQRPAGLTVHVRTATPDSLAAAIAQAVDDVDPALPVRVETRERAASRELSMRRFGTAIMGTMGGVGLLLAMVGLYGVMAYAAASRVPEVGIRMALGASASRIRGEMLRRALVLVAGGVGAGTALSLLVMPVMSTFLAGVSPFDPAAFVGASLLLALAGVAAAYLPARQASTVDPIGALRSI